MIGFPSSRPALRGGVFTTTSTGTVNDLDFGGAAIIRCNNATDLTLGGLKAGAFDGQLVTIYSIGAGHVYLSNQAAGSSAANRLANWITSGPTPLATTLGNATYQYDVATGRWRLHTHNQGDFISIPFASLTFDSDTGAFWTVDAADLATYRFFVTGKQMLVHAVIATTTTTLGVGSRLRVTMSGFQPWTWSGTTRNWYRCNQAGVFTNGMVTAASGTSLVQFSPDVADPAWGVGANNRTIDGATVLLGVT